MPELLLVEAVNDALHVEMQRDEKGSRFRSINDGRLVDAARLTRHPEAGTTSTDAVLAMAKRREVRRIRLSPVVKPM